MGGMPNSLLPQQGYTSASGLRGGIRPAQGLLLGQLHWRSSRGVKSPPTLHHPTSAGMLSPTECPALRLPLQLVGQRELRNVPLSVVTAYCMPEPGCVSDCPQAWQPNNPLDTKAQQSRAAGRWTPIVQWHLPTAGTAVGSSKEPQLLVPAYSCLQSTVSAPAARGCLVLIFKDII